MFALYSFPRTPHFRVLRSRVLVCRRFCLGMFGGPGCLLAGCSLPQILGLVPSQPSRPTLASQKSPLLEPVFSSSPLSPKPPVSPSRRPRRPGRGGTYTSGSIKSQQLLALELQVCLCSTHLPCCAVPSRNSPAQNEHQSQLFCLWLERSERSYKPKLTRLPRCPPWQRAGRRRL